MSDLPYPNEPDRTHWEGCYRSPKHHNCAVEEVDRLRRQLDTAREALQKVPGAINTSYAQAQNERYGNDQMAETCAKIVREVEDDIRRTLAALDGEDKADDN